MANALFICADAGAQVGTGHFMRMLALAEAWTETGGTIAFGGALSASLAKRALSCGASFFDRPVNEDGAEWTISRARQFGAPTVVADGYTFPVTFQRAVRAAGLRLMIVDDNAENAPYEADWILNANVHATESMYERRNQECRCLLGPRFALIRQAIRRGTRKQRVPGARRLLVTMGGADPPNATGRILAQLASDRRGLSITVLVGAANPRLEEYKQAAGAGVSLLHDVADVTSIMLEADVALAAAGGTVWELGLLGVPVVGLSLADNQVQLAEELQRRGAIVYVGDARLFPDAARWLDRVCDVLNDSSRCEALVRASRTLVDGDGAKRVVESIKER
jgi:UDP-2,4-diacetamido-2,4,6-trideoxy-beta-L-altropyranose hydrolase